MCVICLDDFPPTLFSALRSPAHADEHADPERPPAVTIDGAVAKTCGAQTGT
jgi:hypothetical protein